MSDNVVATNQAEDLVAQVDTGARRPANWQGKFIPIMCFVWAGYQIFIASNLPFTLGVLTGSNFFIIIKSEARFVHLAFAIFLAAMAFPLFKNSPRGYIPWYDWALGLIGAGCCLYLLVFNVGIAERAGLPTAADLTISAIGMIILAVSVYRALGLPLVIVASVFVAYVFFGSSPMLPEAVQWKGASFNKAMWHFWMQTEGVFGVALNVSASLIFLFVVFGSILEKAGAGNFFIKIAFALLGHLRGGPAKAAVIASAMSGLYSGSSIANTVTTGTFTIPLMKRTGLSAEKAGAIEVASSTNGQLTPPVMGAAAFLISEFTGVSYQDLIVHALVPALVSYIALVYIVHLEAMKLDLRGLPKPPSSMTLKLKVISFLGGFIGMALLGMAVYYGMGWIKVVAPDAAFSVVVALSGAMYLILLWFASRHPDLVVDDPDAPILELPRPGTVAITGLYYVLPIVILIWCITLERLSPALAAFWAVIAMITVTLTQHPIKAFFRGSGDFAAVFRQGVDEWVDGMISGSRNMIGIGVATGAAGIIVGTIALTGAHQVVGEFVEFLAGGQLLVMLILVAVMSLILGMGLPTTANYIVVSSLMAPVIVALGAKSGLIVPLVAVHLFVFYFGILADDTPPVGLAAFAAAAISGGDPIKTGLQGFAYDIRTALLPFLFLFNTELLLINVGWAKGIFVFVIAVIAMMLFASATQGYLFVRNRIWESAVLLLVAFTLFRPGFWLDMISPPFEARPGGEVMEIIDRYPPGSDLRVELQGTDMSNPDRVYATTLIIPLGAEKTADQRLGKHGLMVMVDNGQALLEEPMPGSTFAALGRQLDFYGDEPVQLTAILLPRERIVKEIFYLPAILLLGLVVLLQCRRRLVEA